jgi:hypothetical protein
MPIPGVRGLSARAVSHSLDPLNPGTLEPYRSPA